MPDYSFQCQNCKKEIKVTMSISDYFDYKEKEKPCLKCGDGSFKQVIVPVGSKIERDKDFIIEEAKREAREITRKIEEGDEKAFIDIYGDKPNSLKNK